MKEYTLRRMTSADIFPLCTIIKKIGIDEVKRIVNSPELMAMVSKAQNKESDATAVGMSFMLDLASLIVGNLPKCESELYKFLSSMTGAGEKELRGISPAEFLELVVSVVKHEDFKDFFVAASRLLK
ncbi:MAG: hypothetical protein ACI4NM_10790 [Bullifex sp.]